MNTKLLLLILPILFLYSCKVEDNIECQDNGQFTLSKTLTVITQEPMYEDYQGWGIISDDDGQSLGYLLLSDNQVHEIPYEVPLDYQGAIHFSLYQLRIDPSQNQGIQLNTYSNITSSTIYLKNDPDAESNIHNNSIRISLDGIPPDDISRVIILPDHGIYSGSPVFEDKLKHIIYVGDNTRFFIGVLIKDDKWKYDFIEPAPGENELKLFPNDFVNESDKVDINGTSGPSWEFAIRNLKEENNTLEMTARLKYSSRDSFYNRVYNIQEVSDVSIPKVFLDLYERHYSWYSASRPANTSNLDGGYLKHIWGAPDLNLSPPEVDFSISHTANKFEVNAVSDYTYTRTSWIKRGDTNLAKNTSWHWDVSGPANSEIAFPILPEALRSQLYEPIEVIEDFESYHNYVVKDSPFPNYSSFLQGIIYEADNNYKVLFPFFSLDFSVDRKIEISYVFDSL